MIRRILMSLNDPQWGRNKGNGPPDLDELWRGFNQKLNNLFRRSGRGDDGGGGGPPSMRQFGGGLGVILALVLGVWLMSGFYIVDASQRGIVLQFGRKHSVTDPGLQWRWPAPIQSHEIVNISQVRTVEIGYRSSGRAKEKRESLMLTDDENIIDIQFAVQWFVKDPIDYLFANRSPDDTVLHAAETAMREIVGKSRMDFVLYEGREQVAVSASKLMQEILDRYKTGIEIQKVTMNQAQPPDEVQAAFDDAVKAGQDRERLKNEGQAYFNDVVPKAKGTASRLFEEASGYRQQVVATAEGDASRFRQVLTEYAKAPGVTRDRMYIDVVQQVLSSATKVLVDSRQGSNLLYLPLDKLMAQTATAAAVAPTETIPPRVTVPDSPGPPAFDPTNSRSRDALRNREREAR